MKRLLLCLLCLCLLLCACTPAAPEADTTEPTAAPTLPQELVGVWVSAHAGERDMVETITFGEDGSLTVNLNYQGADYQTIYGTYTVSGVEIYCEITEGAAPFQVTYTYRIDGRELYLADGEGESQYLRNS